MVVYSVSLGSRLTSAGLALLSTGTPLVLAALSDQLVRGAESLNRTASWFLLLATIAVVTTSLALSTLLRARLERLRLDTLVDAQADATEHFLSRARSAPSGTIKERLVDDLTDIVTMRVSTRPQLAVTVGIAVVSLVWIASISPVALAWAVFGSLLTSLPALVVRRWAERAYEDTTEIEAEIDSEYFQSRECLDLIHTEHLRAYVVGRVRRLDRQHKRVGTLAEATGAAQTGMSNLVQAAALYGSLTLVLWLVSTGRTPLTAAAGAVIVLRNYFNLTGSVANALTDIWVCSRKEDRLRIFLTPGPNQHVDRADDMIHLANFDVRVGGVVRSHIDSLRLKPGKSIHVAGGNGAGKTLLLRGIVGLEDTEGDFASAVSTADLRAGYLGQHDPLLTLTPAELFEEVEATGGNAARSLNALTEILGPTEAERLAGVPIADLSGGQRRAVFVSEALGSSRGLILLDEPDAHLSTEAVARLASVLQHHEDAALVVAHTQRFAQAWKAPQVHLESPRDNE